MSLGDKVSDSVWWSVRCSALNSVRDSALNSVRKSV
jgi:hypothetical protein